MADRYGPDAIRFRTGECVRFSVGYSGDRQGKFLRMVPTKLHADSGLAYVTVKGKVRKVRYAVLRPCDGGD